MPVFMTYRRPNDIGFTQQSLVAPRSVETDQGEIHSSQHAIDNQSCSVDLRPGGTFSSRMEAKDGSMGFDFAGTYTKVESNKRIEYSFGDRKAQVEFAPVQEGVQVRVSFDSEPTHSIEQQPSGWQAILNNFAKHVEGRGTEAHD
jgi:uncharacterized protein YndB with AHSA1/START domain